MCIIARWIVIDQFTKRSNDCVYFLTHWHSDHYQGISNGWKYGPIYASKITRDIALVKYPGLEEKIYGLEIGKWIVIRFGQKKAEVCAIDSNHMAGSVMLLIKTDGLYFLHTGDMRFSSRIALNSPTVFLPLGNGEYQCKYRIEELHLDNTYCDPIFKFPSRSRSLRMLVNLIQELKPTRIFLCTDTIGKEQAFILLGKHFSKRIAVTQARMDYIKRMGFDWRSSFTLDPSETWIQVIPRNQKDQRIGQFPGSIAVQLTGWANLDCYQPDGYNSYMLPYSLHSNFREIELLVSWIKPKKLIPIVREGRGWEKFAERAGSYKSYVFSLTGIRQRGLDFLRKEYCEYKNQEQYELKVQTQVIKEDHNSNQEE